MTDIKPVATVTHAGIHGVNIETLAQAPKLKVGDKLYPESALLQAREEGRREGMREAAALMDAVANNPTSSLRQRDLAAQFSKAITRASEGK